MANLIMLPVLFLVMMSSVTPQNFTGTVATQTTTGPLYPMAKNLALGPTDDESSPRIELKQPFLYFGEIYRYIYINNNGHLTFEEEYEEYDPERFPLNGSFGIIAPFWIDLNTTDSGAVYSDQYTNGSVLQQATEDINEYFPWLSFTASWVMVVTWNDVPFYEESDRTATFQAVLISGDEDSFLLMNYGRIDSIPEDVQAGFDTVNSTHHVILPGSFAFDTPTNTTSFHLSSNVNETGRWAFKTGKGCSFNESPNLFRCPDDCPRLEEYSQLCSIINNSSGPFAACHQQSDPQPFFNSCVYDLCRLTSANGTLCSAVSAYERTCSVSELSIPEWRLASQCESEPCKELYCTEFERCGEKDGVYDCLCDENHQRPDNETFESTLTCAGSSANISVSRCQLFEDGFHSSALHLQDESCKGHLQDGQLVFHFNNDDQLCGTVLRSNGTHFLYGNSIQGHVDPNEGPISRQRNIHLGFQCAYPLDQALDMAVGINPLESIVNKNLPSTNANYRLRMTPYQDSGFSSPLTSDSNIEEEISKPLFVEVLTEDLDASQISIILDSCWATPVNMANYPVRWDLISDGCPNPDDGSVEILQNGVSLAARFSFKMFTFINSSSIYLHCKVHLCLLKHNNCSTQCSPDSHTRVQRDVTYHDTTDISVGPLVLTALGRARGRREVSMEGSTASGQLTSVVILLVSLLTATTLT